MNKKNVDMMSPLTWAYVGDSVYELYIRNYLVNTTTLKPNKLHIEAIKYVKARRTSKYYKKSNKRINSRGTRNSKKNAQHRKSSFA